MFNLGSIELSHVAVVVPSLENSLKILSPKYHVGNIETFHEKDDGKTLEAYVGSGLMQSGQLLLIEPLESKWFLQFVSEFGFGLHHVAINVTSLVDYCNFLYQKGWYLHTSSVFGYQNLHTIYLVRPGIPLIIEVQQQKIVERAENRFISEILLQVKDAREESCITSLGIAELFPVRNKRSLLKMDNKEWDIAEIAQL